MSKLQIVMYHYVRDLRHSRYNRIKGMDYTYFKQQIQYLKNHYNIVEMELVMDAVEGKAKLPENALLLTFDDGYIDHYTYVMPILEEFKAQGSFFIPGKTFSTHQLLDVNKVHYILASAKTEEILVDVKKAMDYYRGTEYTYPSTEELIEKYAVANRFDNGETIFVKRMLQTALPEKVRNLISSDLFAKYVGISEEQLSYELYMTEEQIKTMKRHGMYIGCHGYDHYWLGNLPTEKMQEDILKALEIMGEFMDCNRWAMNYPYGNHSDELLDFIKSKGACVGLTVEAREADLSQDNALKLPRFDCNDIKIVE